MKVLFYDTENKTLSENTKGQRIIKELLTKSDVITSCSLNWEQPEPDQQSNIRYIKRGGAD